MNSPSTKVAIIGSGKIGIDLMYKVFNCPQLELFGLIGRTISSQGLALARNRGVLTSTDGIDFVCSHLHDIGIIFDATSAAAHFEHAPIFKAAHLFTIDLTPSNVGIMCVPSINLAACDNAQNISLISCGAQASLPLANAVKRSSSHIEYLEVVSTIASASAGLATRENIDQYLTTTELALKHFSGARQVKTILNINPARPGIVMQTTLYAYADFKELAVVQQCIAQALADIQRYVPGVKLILGPVIDKQKITIGITVTGSGDYLPEYAGNLDIINCAAMAVAERRHRVAGGTHEPIHHA